MTKQEFLGKIQNGIKGVPKKDIDKHLQYYSEMIDDRIEDGMDEADAVSAAGDVDAIVKDILQEKSDNHFAKKIKGLFSENKGFSCIKPVLKTSLCWVCKAFVVVVLSLAIIGLYVASVSLGGAGLMGLGASTVLLLKGVAWVQSLVMLGASLLSMGISVLLFILANCCVKASIKLLKRVKNNEETEKEEP